MSFNRFLFVFMVTFLFVTLVTGQRNNVGRKSDRTISDGHRLITRALWRIFDALMEKKNHEELYGRMKFVENSLTNFVSSDAKINTQISSLMSSLNNYKLELSSMKKEIEKIKRIEYKIRDMEDWQLKMESPRDDSTILSHKQVRTKAFHGSPVSAYAEPEYITCPPPFETVGTECIYVYMEHKKSWHDSRSECARIGGDLAAPMDLQPLRDFLRDLPRNKRPEYIWMGGSKTEDGTWIWSTGSQAGRLMDMSQATWNEELPEGIGDCFGLYERAGYRAYDYTCGEEDYFICQYFF